MVFAGTFRYFFPCLDGASNLSIDDARCGGEFRTTFRTIPAFVAQWIEQRFPKPQVAGPIPAEGAVLKVFANVLLQFSIGYSRATCLSAMTRIRW